MPRLSAAVLVGIGIGYALGWMGISDAQSRQTFKDWRRLVALGVTLIVYGFAETVHGCGAGANADL